MIIQFDDVFHVIYSNVSPLVRFVVGKRHCSLLDSLIVVVNDEFLKTRTSNPFQFGQSFLRDVIPIKVTKEEIQIYHHVIIILCANQQFFQELFTSFLIKGRQDLNSNYGLHDFPVDVIEMTLV